MRRLHWKDLEIPSNAFHLSLTTYRPDERFPIHDHDFAEIMLIESGVGWQAYHGRRVELSPGQLTLIRPHDAHTIVAGSEGLVLLNAAFPIEVALSLELQYFPGESGYFGRTGELPYNQKLHGEDREDLVERFHRSAVTKKELFDLHYLLLSVYACLRSPFADSEFVGAPEWLRHACLEIRSPENFIVGVHRLYDLAGRSREHTSRELRRYTGKTPTEFVSSLRLDHAGKLLSSRVDIAKVALDCGFESLSWFYRSFKDRFGLTPREYQDRHTRATTS